MSSVSAIRQHQDNLNLKNSPVLEVLQVSGKSWLYLRKKRVINNTTVQATTSIFTGKMARSLLP